MQLEPADSTAAMVTSKMSAAEVIAVLVQGQYCSNITNKLDLARCSNFRAADGGLSDIYQGALNGGEQVAIKCPRVLVSKADEQAAKILKRTARELYTWSRLKHKNVLELYGLANFRGYMAMISPWMDKGTILDYIRQNPKADRWRLCVDISEGLAYLHEDDVKHGDLKSMNILVSSEGIAKVADFGCTELKNSGLVFTTTDSKSGTLRWSSPEKLENGLPSKEDDVYALGMVFLEIITSEVPFSDIHTDAQLLSAKLFHKKIPLRPAEFPTFSMEEADALWEIALDTWAYEASDRPSCETVMTRLREIKGTRQPKVVSKPLDQVVPPTIDITSSKPNSPVSVAPSEPTTIGGRLLDSVKRLGAAAKVMNSRTTPNEVGTPGGCQYDPFGRPIRPQKRSVPDLLLEMIKIAAETKRSESKIQVPNN